VRIAALYDVHGNLPALEAVLAEVAREGVDRVVVGGDVVPGPMPDGCLDALRSRSANVDFLRGNGDRETLVFRAGGTSASVPESVHRLLHWNAARLTDDHAAWIASWRETVRHGVTGLGEVLFCHATPRDDDEIFTAVTPDESLRPVFEPTGAGIVVCGHTHMQFDRCVGDVRIVNAGSVGMSFEGTGAYWLLLGPDVELRRTEYDLAAAAARIRATDYPQAEEFATGNVLTTPSADQMRASFEKVALR